jgi:DNA polymerase III epsilon subunit-like protein
MDKFIAIDFETAHGKRYSACAIGIVVVENNQITERFHTLIQPPENKYFYKNIEIHGITPKMTENAPTFDYIYPTIHKYLNNSTVVSHNAAFDMDVLAKTMNYYGLLNDDLDFNFSCTLNIYGGGLKECCKEFNIPLKHHDPLSDAEACAILFSKANDETKRNTVKKFRESYLPKPSEIDEYASQQFYFNNEAKKAINTLKGILLGVLMDKEINVKEINELEKWSENQFYMIDHHPFKELMQLITETTDIIGFDLSTAIDMYNICQEFEANFYSHSKSYDLQILNGIFHGILADGVIKDIEVLELEKWLSENEHLSKLHPYDEVYSIVKTILKDRQVDDDERKRLKSFIYDFVELANKEVDQQIKSEISEIPIHGICAIKPEIAFDGKLFCLSGNFEHGEKQYIEDLIRIAGGNTKPSFVKGIDYLIVGSLGEKSWAYNSYGTKIAKALKLQKEGGSITIVHESDLWNSIQNYIN